MKLALNKYRHKTREQLIREIGKSLRYIDKLEKSVSKQKQIESKLRTLSLTDDLTGLYNRRGFFLLSEQQLKIAKRIKKDIILLYADIDNLKKINDTFGHHEGSRAIINTANILKSTCRNSDIVARLGGDEFVVLPVGVSDDNTDVISARIQKNIDSYNEKKRRRYPLSLSCGIKKCESQEYVSLDEILIQADRLMYEEKRRKQKIT